MKTESLLKYVHQIRENLSNEEISRLVQLTRPSEEEVRRIAEEVYHTTKRDDSVRNWEDAEIIACVLSAFHFFPSLKIKAEEARTWAEPKLAALKKKITSNTDFKSLKKTADSLAREAKEKLPELYVSLLIKAVQAKGEGERFLSEHFRAS